MFPPELDPPVVQKNDVPCCPVQANSVLGMEKVPPLVVFIISVEEPEKYITIPELILLYVIPMGLYGVVICVKDPLKLPL